VSTCAKFVAYFSFKAEGVKWITDQCISLVIIIGLMACVPLEIIIIIFISDSNNVNHRNYSGPVMPRQLNCSGTATAHILHCVCYIVV